MLSVLTLCLFAPQAPTTQAVFEAFSLQHLCGAPTALTPPPWGSMLRYTPTPEEERPDLLGARAEEPQFEPDHVRELLSARNQAAVEAGELALETRGDSLCAFGNAAAVESLRTQLRELTSQVCRPLQVEVALWDVTGREAPAAILGPREYAQFAGDRQPLWRSLAVGRSSRPVALDRQRWTRYVRDIDPEVAQKQGICNPITDAFGEGGRVLVLPHALVGGDDLVLHVQFGFAARRGAVRTVPSGIPGSADLEVPTLETLYGACSGRITNGGALAVTLRGHLQSGGEHVLTVRVTGRTPPAARLSAGIGIFPTSALTTGALSQRLSPPSPYPRLGDDSPEPAASDESWGFGRFEPEQLQELLRRSLGQLAEENFDAQIAGGHLFVRGGDEALARTDNLLRALQERLLRNVTVRHSGHLVAGLGETGVAGQSQVLLHDLVLPTLLGRHATVCRVLETNVVRDLAVTIAQEASLVDPIVEALQAGAWLRVCAAPVDGLMHVQLLAQCAQAPLPQVRSLNPAGILMPADVASVRTMHDAIAVAGQAIEHGDGPLVLVDGRACRSALVTTVAW